MEEIVAIFGLAFIFTILPAIGAGTITFLICYVHKTRKTNEGNSIDAGNAPGK